MGGSDAVVAKLPLMSLGPMVGLYYGATVADKVSFTDEFIEYEFSPVSLRAVKKNQLYDEFLKAIDTKFAPLVEGDEDSAMQLIVDENMVNGVIGQFLKIEKNYSLRELLTIDPRLAVMRQMLTTTTIGLLIPSFKEQYGEGKNVDLVVTASHDYMVNGLGEEVPATGLHIEENGNFQIIANLGAQLIVDGKDHIQQEARSLYLTLALKGKLFIADA